jgi:PAS domain S-box-containing protein
VEPKLFYIEVLMSSSNGFQTERKESEAKYRGLLEAAPDGMVVVNQDGEIVLLNARAEKQFGYRRDELLGQKVTNIIPEGFAERLIADALRTTAEALEQQIGTGIELCGLRKGGSEFPIEIMLSPLESAEGILVTAAIRDITERKVAEERIRFLAYYDALTGLPNRTLLQDRLTKALASALRRKEKLHFCSSTSTGSKTSTTHSGTRSATFSCKTLQNGLRAVCVNRTPWDGWAVTNSSSCSLM